MKADPARIYSWPAPFDSTKTAMCTTLRLMCWYRGHSSPVTHSNAAPEMGVFLGNTNWIHWASVAPATSTAKPRPRPDQPLFTKIGTGTKTSSASPTSASKISWTDGSTTPPSPTAPRFISQFRRRRPRFPVHRPPNLSEHPSSSTWANQRQAARSPPPSTTQRLLTRKLSTHSQPDRARAVHDRLQANAPGPVLTVK